MDKVLLTDETMPIFPNIHYELLPKDVPYYRPLLVHFDLQQHKSKDRFDFYNMWVIAKKKWMVLMVIAKQAMGYGFVRLAKLLWIIAKKDRLRIKWAHYYYKKANNLAM